MATPTLIEDLEAAADSFAAYGQRARAARLREHARRLAALFEHDSKQPESLVREMLQHINGGPSTAESGDPGEPTT